MIGETLAAFDYPFLETIVAGIAAFLLGIVWYHPKVLGTRWAEARGISNSDIKPDVKKLAISQVLWLLSACFYSFMVMFLQIDALPGLFCLSCLLWVAFTMPPSLMGALYTGYAFEAVSIDAAYHLAGYYIFAVVHFLTKDFPVL